MEHETSQRRSMATIKTMGLNTYSQIVSAFRAQGDLTDEKSDILPVLQNAFGISRERHTAEVKRALFDEQLTDIASNVNPSSSSTTNWEAEANYAFPTVVHRPPNTKNVQLAEEILQTTPPTVIIQHSQANQAPKLNRDLQKLVHDELKNDGIVNATQQQPNASTNRFTLPNFTNNDIQGSNVVRLVRAKQAPKRKTSLDTLIEVVQKELLRVNKQNASVSPPESPYFQSRSVSSTKSSHRSIVSSVLPTNPSFKLARKRGVPHFNQTKKSSPFQQYHRTDDEFDTSFDDISTAPENIDEIVRETVDRLVAMTLLNTAPYVVNMLTTIPTSTDSTNNKSQMKTDFTIDRRNSPSQTSPMKPQQQIHHSQIILQSTPTTPSTTPTVFVTPRILNFQTVVPKPTKNIQIGNTKIILVSPSTTPSTSQTNTLANNSVKLVKFTTNNPQIPSTTTNTNSSTLTLPKNLQIVIPSQTPSTIQLTRTNHDEANKPLSTATTFRPVTTVPIGLKTCALDHIPQAAQEVTISASPPPPASSSTTSVQTNTNELHQQSALDHNSRTSPNQDEMIKSVSVNFPNQSSQIQRPTSTHGPMIFRMTSVNPNVPVIRVRATAPTTAPTVINKSIKTDAKPLSITPATNMCYEPKPTHSTPTSSGSVSVLACFKTTKKRNKERAIMPRPSTNESTEISSTNSNSSLVVNNDYPNATNSSPDSRRQHQTSLSSVNSDEINQEQIVNDLTTLSNSKNFIEEKSNQSRDDKRLFDDDDEEDEDNWLIEGENFLKTIFDKEYFQILDSIDQEFIRTKFDLIQTDLFNGTIASKNEFIQIILQSKPESPLSNDNLNQFFTTIKQDLSKICSDSKRLRQQ